jgi:integrase
LDFWFTRPAWGAALVLSGALARFSESGRGAAQIGKLATHTMRHAYRSWLDAVGTGIVVQQKLMRHVDIGTTLNVYGSQCSGRLIRDVEFSRVVEMGALSTVRCGTILAADQQPLRHDDPSER